MEYAYHTPVLLKETVDGLKIVRDGIYVDCTFGGGGHTRAILEKLGREGRLIVFDQDEDAWKNLPDDKRITLIRENFRHLNRFLKLQEVNPVHGILADLGVSSHQFDEPERGFSIRHNAALDMRMDKRQPITAYDVVQTCSEEQLHKIFEQYGEVRNAKTLARTLVQIRGSVPLKTMEEFRNAIRGIVKGNPNKYFAQVFQAIRIEVNDELGALKELLQQIPVWLRPGGRVAILTYHSLEDRLVKNFFRRGTNDEPELHPYINQETTNDLMPVNKKPMIPTNEERQKNPRSRSAKLRIAEKIKL